MWLIGSWDMPKSGYIRSPVPDRVPDVQAAIQPQESDVLTNL